MFFSARGQNFEEFVYNNVREHGDADDLILYLSEFTNCEKKEETFKDIFNNSEYICSINNKEFNRLFPEQHMNEKPIYLRIRYTIDNAEEFDKKGDFDVYTEFIDLLDEKFELIRSTFKYMPHICVCGEEFIQDFQESGGLAAKKMISRINETMPQVLDDVDNLVEEKSLVANIQVINDDSRWAGKKLKIC